MKRRNANNNTWKRAVSFFLIMLLTCSFWGCGEKTEDDSLKKVLDSGELVLGLDENFPPMGFRDAEGNLTGFDLDLADEVCRRLGVKLTLRPIDWDCKEDDLNEGRIDCIWNGLSVSPERAESMNLSDPYLKNELIFAASKGSGIKTINDLNGKKIGVQSGSSAQDALKRSDKLHGTETVTADDNVKLLEQLEAGELDAVFMDSIFAYFYISEYNKDYYILPTVLETEDIAIGFRKNDNTLRDKVQAVLSEMKADGTLAEISTNWFGTDVTTVR